jgi:hypothetical protein
MNGSSGKQFLDVQHGGLERGTTSFGGQLNRFNRIGYPACGIARRKCLTDGASFIAIPGDEVPAEQQPARTPIAQPIAIPSRNRKAERYARRSILALLLAKSLLLNARRATASYPVAFFI